MKVICLLLIGASLGAGQMSVSQGALQEFSKSQSSHDIARSLIGVRVTSEDINVPGVLVWDGTQGFTSAVLVTYQGSPSVDRDAQTAQSAASQNNFANPQALGVSLHNGTVFEVRDYPYFSSH